MLFPAKRTGRRGIRAGWMLGGVLLAAIMAVVCGAVVGLVAGTSAEVTGPQNIPTAAGHAEVVQVSAQDIKALLDAQNTALKTRDLAGFIKPFRADDTALVTAQKRLFTNLNELPLTGVHFETVKQEGRAQDGFGRGVTFALDVALVHQFSGIDVAPVSQWYRWTLTRAAAHTPLVITAVTGAPAAYGSSKTVFYPAPWDLWSTIHVERTAHTIVLADSSLAAQAARYAPVAEAAAVDDVRVWRASNATTAAVPTGFVICLVASSAELGGLFRVKREPVTEAGVSIAMPTHLSLGTATATAYGATRVVINARSEFFDDTTGPREIFRHELAHSMVAFLDTGKTLLDTWVVEGFAEYLANRGLARPDRRLPGARRLIGAGRFSGRLPDNASWDTEGLTSFHYWLGRMAVQYLAARYGEAAAVGFVAAHYQGHSSTDALRQTTGVDLDTFEHDWAVYVRAHAR
jgi:hypothetical protein